MEFVLVLPVFLMLVLGIAEFGRAFNIQVSLSEAARETARYAAIHYSETGYTQGNAQNVGMAAAPTVPLAAGNIVIGTCSPGANVVVTVTYATSYLTGLPGLIPGLPANLSISSKGVMRCGG